MFSMNQDDFTFQDWCCRLTSAVHMAFNNKLNKDISIDDISNISRYCISEHKQPMSETWNQIWAGIHRIKWFIKKYYKKNLISMDCQLFWDLFATHINKWRLLAINIHSSKEFKALRKTWKKIEWDFTNSKSRYWHRLCIFKLNWKYYLLNSWNPKDNIREIDINVKWLFKSNKATVLY